MRRPRHRRPRRKKTTCDGKERIPTMGEARGKATRVQAVTGANHVSAYKCRFCGGYHVGRR